MDDVSNPGLQYGIVGISPPYARIFHLFIVNKVWYDTVTEIWRSDRTEKEGRSVLLTAEDRKRNLTDTVGEKERVERMRELIGKYPWQFAKSMPYIPHEYSLKRYWDRDEFNEFLKFIWDYGVDAWFGNSVTSKRYWFDHENGYYYFIDPLDIDDDGKATHICQLFNRGRIQSYEFWEEVSLLGELIRCKVRHG